MRRKKIISLVTCITLMLSTTVPVMASIGTNTVIQTLTSSAEELDKGSKDAKVTKEEAKKAAIKEVKDLFEIAIDENKFDFDGDFQSEYGINGHPAWFLHWYSHDDKKSINVSVQVDAMSGTIIEADYNEYFNDDAVEMLPSMTREDAAEIAKAFVKKHYPNKYKQLNLSEDNHVYYGRYRSNDYNFNFNREINGIPYTRNFIDIGVNGITGKVASYRSSWDPDAVFPKSEGVIDQQIAEETFKQNTKMALQYVPVEDENSYSQTVEEVKLAYNIEYLNNSNMVNAFDNTMVEPKNGEKLIKEKTKDLTTEQRQKLKKAVKSFSESDKEINENQAMELIQKFKKEFFDESYEINEIELIQDSTDWQSRGKKVWSAEIVKKEENSEHYFDGIIIDALTGELVAINNYAMSWEEKEFTPKLTWEEAYDQAVELLIQYFPEQAKQVRTEQTYTEYSSNYREEDTPPRRYGFDFPRIVGGLEYYQDSISMEFDTETGILTGLGCRWDEDLSFPDPGKAISAEKAKEVYFDTHSPQLSYMDVMPDQNTEASTKSQIQLVYILQSDIQDTYINGIDAITGKSLDYTGHEITEEKSDFTQKVKNHPNQKELQILVSSGIIEPDIFVSNQDITMMEWLKMLVNAKGYRPYMVREAEDLKFTNIEKPSETYNYLQMAVKYGFIENKGEAFDPKEKITREEMAKMLIIMLEYNDIAKMKNIFAVDFTDAEEIDPDFVGSVAIAKGLGIFEEDTFRPKEYATYMECAVGIYKALQQMPEE